MACPSAPSTTCSLFPHLTCRCSPISPSLFALLLSYFLTSFAASYIHEQFLVLGHFGTYPSTTRRAVPPASKSTASHPAFGAQRALEALRPCRTHCLHGRAHQGLQQPVRRAASAQTSASKRFGHSHRQSVAVPWPHHHRRSWRSALPAAQPRPTRSSTPDQFTVELQHWLQSRSKLGEGVGAGREGVNEKAQLAGVAWPGAGAGVGLPGSFGSFGSPGSFGSWV